MVIRIPTLCDFQVQTLAPTLRLSVQSKVVTQLHRIDPLSALHRLLATILSHFEANDFGDTAQTQL